MNHTHETLPYCFLKLSSKCKHFQSVFTLTLMILLMSFVLMTNAAATELRPKAPGAQKIWNKTCFTCHGDSSDIARNYLKVVDGELQGPMHKETFRNFLTNHYLSKTKADAIYSMLLTQANTKTRFEIECSSCHKSAKEFVYYNLEINRGVLFSKKSGDSTYSFLETHRDLTKNDIQFFMRQLTTIGYEIFLPKLTE